MQIKTVKYLLISLIITLYACNKNDVFVVSSNSDVKQFIENEKEINSYEKKIKDVNFKLKYISNEQMALQQVSDITKINQVQFDSIVKNYDSLLFFNLQIDIDNFNEELLKYKLGGNIDASYSQRVDYYAFKMQKDINIVLAEKDTIPCMMYHFERNYGVSPKNNFMIGFKLSNFKNAVLVYDNNLLQTGIIKFELKEKEITHHTHIKIK